MTVKKEMRLSKIAREFNLGLSTIVEYLNKKGVEVPANPNAKVSPEAYEMLQKEYSAQRNIKKEVTRLSQRKSREKKETISLEDIKEKAEENDDELDNEGEEVVLIKDAASTLEVPANNKKEEKTEKEKATSDESFEVEETQLLADVKKELKQDIETVKQTEETAKVEEEQQHHNEPQERPEDQTPHEKEETETTELEKESTEEDTVTEIEHIDDVTDGPENQIEEDTTQEPRKEGELKVLGKIDLDSLNQKTRPRKKTRKEKEAERREKEQRENEQRKQDRHKYKESKKTKEKHPSEEEKPAEIEDKVTPPQKEDKDNGDEVFKTNVEKLSGPTVVGKIELPSKADKKKPIASSNENKKSRRRRKKSRRKDDTTNQNTKDKQHQSPHNKDNKDKRNPRKDRGKKKQQTAKHEVSEEDVQKQIKETLARLTASKQKGKGAKYRRDKRDQQRERQQEEEQKQLAEEKVLKVTEFVSVNELANMMDVAVNEIISTCMSLGLFVSINQRLDAETMSLVAEEFGYTVEFTSIDIQDAVQEEEDDPEDLEFRSPIVTVMGHVDHGKTSLLDYIRSSNVIAGEAGGITQHIGAYKVSLPSGKKITFLDTPGHEAFTAMRARGAQVTDIAIIVIAADDDVMPQTVEAINHASAAGVPIVFAINKIDRPNANPDKIKEKLASMNYMVEEWGGKYQSHDISAKQGLHIEELLEKVLLEAEMLELTANPDKRAVGTIIESSLDKGRGYVATLLVQAGKMKIGDIVLAGAHTGRIKAMFNERGKPLEQAGPSDPVLILGLDGAPQAGDKFHVMEAEREAREIATKVNQLQREQALRSRKYITLDEIGRRIAIGNFQELNLIVKGDVDGSIEALSDSLIKLSTEEIQVNVIHKAVGQITEWDVMLAAASDAIIVGFQVRPSVEARRVAEREGIDIRLYSIIYAAIEEIKAAMEGMLSPEIKEEILGTAEVRETFKITKVGTVAGCYVQEGKLLRNAKVRVIRDGIVVYTGDLGSLKRFKDDVKEVSSGFECGLNIERFNDIKVGDAIEGFQEVEVKKTLS